VEGTCSGLFPNSFGIPTNNGEKSLKKARNAYGVDKICIRHIPNINLFH
jgi:hypothetical protein